jgi:hypothetical protein
MPDYQSDEQEVRANAQGVAERKEQQVLVVED